MARGYHERHGMSKSPEYGVWAGMIARCTKSKCWNYNRYGGRGIKVCNRWLSFCNFISDMGRRPSNGHSIERVNNDGNYCPENCRWATKPEQWRNRSDTKFLEVAGFRATLSEWSEATGIPKYNIKNRINNLGWDAFRAVTTPVEIQRIYGQT